MRNTNNEIPVFDVSLVATELSDDAKAIMKSFEEKTLYISECAKTMDKYDKAINTLSKNLLYGFEFENFRTYPVQFKFKQDVKEDTKWLPFRLFIINMIMWRPQMCIDPEAWTPDLIIHPSESKKIGPKYIKKYFDTNYVSKYNRYIPSMPGLKTEDIRGELSCILGETTFILQQTTSKFSKFFGISSSIETFIDLAKRIPEFNEAIYYKLDETKQPAEMEKDLDDEMKKVIDLIIKDDKFNLLKPLFDTNSGLNVGQARDMILNRGLKPGEDGRTISYPINTNFLTGGGVRDTVDYYINGISSRKAAMINNEFMGKSGHLLILIAIAAARAVLSKTCMDCNTVNPIPIEIKTETHLAKMHGRYYRFHGEKNYHILNADTDKALVGETLEFRSPITCACKDGICKTCYGELWYTNIDNEVAGIYSATIVMNPVVQGILSAKHHQKTNSSPIVFNEYFDQFFKIAATDIILNIDQSIDPTEYCLIIRREEIKLTDDEDLELDFEKKRRKRKKASDDSDDDSLMDSEDGSLELSMKYYVTKFQVAKNLHTKGKTPEYYDFEDIDKKELFIHTDFINSMSPDVDEFGQYLYIEFEDIDPEKFIFLVDVENNELTKPMKQIQKVLNNKDHEGCNTYEEMTNKMLDLMIASKLDAAGVHAEMIIRELVRRKGNNLRRPDFSKIVMSQDVDLMTINSALKKNPSITTSLSTPYLKDQLVNLTETFDKSAASIFDPLFKPGLYTDEDIEDYHRRRKAGTITDVDL